MIVIVWHLLAENIEYDELGQDFTGRNETQQRANHLVAELRRLGQTVTLQPAHLTVSTPITPTRRATADPASRDHSTHFRISPYGPCGDAVGA